MVLFIRILFGVIILAVFWLGSIALGEWIHSRIADAPDGEEIMTIAHQLVSFLLAVFFTLWCVKAGIV